MFALVVLNFTTSHAPVTTSYERTQLHGISSTNIELRCKADNEKYELYKAYARTYGLHPHNNTLLNAYSLYPWDHNTQ